MDCRLLILETSGRIGQVALAAGGSLLTCRHLDQARRHARDLAPAIAELLAAKSWQPRELQGVIVSRGPGSYTGLRVGIMSAKTLAYALGCTLLAVDTFAAIAYQSPTEVSCVEVIADAQQDRIYLQTYARNVPAGAWEPQLPLAIVNKADWLDRREANTWITGPGLHVHRDSLVKESLVVAADRWDPQPESLLQIGLARYLAGERDDYWSLEPLYLRPSAAEEKWQTRSTL